MFLNTLLASNSCQQAHRKRSACSLADESLESPHWHQLCQSSLWPISIKDTDKNYVWADHPLVAGPPLHTHTMYSLLNSHHTTVLASVLYNPECPGLKNWLYTVSGTRLHKCVFIWYGFFYFHLCQNTKHTHTHLKLHTTVDTTGNEPIFQNVQTDVLLEYSWEMNN